VRSRFDGSPKEGLESCRDAAAQQAALPPEWLQVQWVQGPIAGTRACRSRLIEKLPCGSEDARASR